MFARTPRLAMLVFEPTFAGLAIYTVFTAAADWRRFASLGLLVALVAVNLIRMPLKLQPALRWLLAMGLIAITGGADSPLQPVLLISALLHAAIFDKRIALAHCGLSIAAIWIMTLLQAHPQTSSYVRAVTLMPLLIAAFCVGTWIREMSDFMLRSSLEARDEILRTYKDRFRELQLIRGGMAHALKNPLACIKGLVGLMALEPERAPERLEVLRTESCRMQTIIDEYLDFSRPLTPLTMETIDVKAAVSEVVKLHEGMAGAKQVSLDVSQVDPVAILGDRRKLKQMLMSLVVNAIEASECGLPVELTCRRQGERLELAVLDRGPGVPVELLPRLSIPGVTTKESGTGLGLTVVKALAEQHGGTLRLRNRDGGGFAAELDLPLRCPERGDKQLA